MAPEINIDGLKIDDDVVRSTRSFPFVAVVVSFLIGLVCGLIIIYLSSPSLFTQLTSGAETPGNVGETSQQSGQSGNQASANPGANNGAAANTNNKSTVSSFTEGGWIEAPSYHPVIVSSLIAGRLEELNVLEGSKVKKGDVLALLYDKDYQDEVAKADAELKTAEANLARLKAGFRVQEIAQTKAEVAAAKAEWELEEKECKRTRELLAAGSVSAEDLDRDEAACDMAKAKYDSLQQELALKEEGSRQEDIDAGAATVLQKKAMLELARNRLSYTKVSSPMDGTVFERFVTPGAYIPAGNPQIVSLYDPQDLQVRVDVRLDNLSGVFLGQSVEVMTDVERDRSYKGEVIRLDPKADFKKNTVQVKIKLLETSENLYPEMIARIKFIGRNDDEVDGEN